MHSLQTGVVFKLFEHLNNGLTVIGQEALELEAVGKHFEELDQKLTTPFTTKTIRLSVVNLSLILCSCVSGYWGMWYTK